MLEGHRSTSPAAALCAAALLLACGSKPPGARPDAGGAPDAGRADAGKADSGSDAGRPDAGASDAGSTDAGQPDAGATDAGASDAGPLVATQLLLVSGDGQSDVAGATLASPLVVMAADALGNGVGGVTVTWQVTAGNGSVSAASATTASDGTASTTATLGTAAGANSFAAASAGLSGSPVSFGATGTPGLATSLGLVSGDNQAGVAGAPLGQPLVVVATDQYGNGVPNVAVAFASQSGGSVDTPSAQTGATGEASANATLGPTAGAQTFTAENAALLGSPVTFAATASAGAPAAIAYVQGDGQSAAAGSAFPVALAVKVTDANGNPVAGVPVAWSAAGGGSVSAATASTDASGLSSVTATAGSAAGGESFTADATGLAGTPVVFGETALPGGATQLALASGDGQTGTAGAQLALPLAVRATDGFGNPVAGVTVSWTATSGGGGVSAAATQTDATGLATVNATLGTAAGSDAFSASAAGLSGSPIAFGATALAGPAAQLSIAGGDGQTGTAGAQLAQPLAAFVGDSYGNPVAGVSVAWATPSGGGSVNAPSTPTGGNGIAVVSATLGKVAGPNAYTASVSGLASSPVTFTETGVAGAAASIALVSGDAQNGAAGSALPAPLVVKVADANGNAVQGYSVAWSATSGGGAISPASSTAADGTASTTATLGTAAGSDAFAASGSGLAGSPVAFTATAVAGPAAQLLLFSGNNQTKAVFGNYAPLYVQVVDAYSNPVAGVPVTWAKASGGGSIVSSTSPTDANGKAYAVASTGCAPGAQSYTATSGTLAGSPVAFDETATIGPAYAMALKSGDGQTGAAGSALAQQLAVKVTDQCGNGVPGTAVAWAATSGGGSVSAASTSTDSTGVAAVTATLGTTASANGYGASSGTLTGSPVTFTATATAGAAANLAIASGDAQSGTVGTQLSAPLVVLVTDAWANPVAGATVSWSAGSGGVSAASTVTDANGHAQVTATLGTAAGAQTFTAASGALAGSPATFTATATAAAPSKLVFSTPPLTASAGQCAGPLTVQAQDAYGNPSAVSSAAALALASTSTGGAFFGSSSCSTAPPASIAAGGATASFYLKDTAAGTPTETATATGLGSASQVETIRPAAASQLVIVSAPQTLTAGACSAAVVLQTQDAYGNAAPVSSPLSISLSSTSTGNTFYSDACVTASSTLTVFSGSTATFYFRDTKSGAPFETAYSSIGNPYQGETVNAGPPVKIAIVTAPQALTAGACSAAITVQRQDVYGNPAAPGSTTAVALASTSSGNTFFSDACATAATGVTIASGASAATFYLRDTTAGTPTETASTTSLGGASQAEQVNAAAASKIVFTSAPQSLAAGACSGAVGVQTQDAYGNASPVSALTTLALASTSSGNTFYAGACVTPTTSLTLTGGSSSTTFYFRDTAAGSPVETVSSAALASGAQTESIAPGPPQSVYISSPPQTVTAGACSGAATLTVSDAYGNVVPVSSNTLVTLASTSSANTFYSDACVTPVSGVTIPAGASSATFHFADTKAGTPTEQLSATGLVGGGQQETITAAAPALLAKYSGDGQSARTGSYVQIAVQVTDGWGNPTSGVGITWAAPSGGGTLSGTSTTGANGVASVLAKLGPTSGTDTFTASNAALTPTTVTFTETALTFVMQFTAAPSLPTAVAPWGIAAGDLDNDGKVDLVVTTDAPGAGTVSIFKGNGDGTFAAPITFNVGGTPQGVALADLDNDGNLDLVFADYGGSVLVWYGNGALAFPTQRIISVGGGPSWVGLADLNGDGYRDLLVLERTNAVLATYLGSATKTWTLRGNCVASLTPYQFALGDVNGDGKTDAVIANSGSDLLVTCTGKGDGTFNTSVGTSLPAGSHTPMTVALGDFNADGRVDCVTADSSSANASVFTGTGVPSSPFLFNANYGPDSGAFGTVVADFDGDGRLDFGISNQTSSNVTFYDGNGDATFSAPLTYGVGTTPIFMVTADFNGDGKPDVAVANNGDVKVSVLIDTSYTF